MALVLNSGNFLQTVFWGSSQDVTFSGTSAQSSAIGTLGQTPRRVIRIVSDAPCRILIGLDPTALATSTLLPAGVVEYTEITPGHKVAALQESAGGKLNITEGVIA